MPELSSSVRRALESALEHGFFGKVPLDVQIDHAQAFGTCAELALKQLLGTEPRRDLDRGLLRRATMVVPDSFLDLGSGGGLPGLVLADRWKRSRVVLLEANVRRAKALTEAVGECGWEDRVRVANLRAEMAGRSELRGSFDLVVARSFGPPPVTAECSAPFLRVGGMLVVSEPPAEASSGRGPLSSIEFLTERNQERWPKEGLAILGLEVVSVWRDRFGFEVLRQVSPCDGRFPRRHGVPRKRPIYRVGQAERGGL